MFCISSSDVDSNEMRCSVKHIFSTNGGFEKSATLLVLPETTAGTTGRVTPLRKVSNSVMKSVTVPGFLSDTGGWYTT